MPGIRPNILRRAPRGPTVRIPENTTIWHHLEKALVEHAHRVAVEAWPGGQRLTYAQLDAASAALAAELHRRRVGPGVIVPLVMPRCLDYLVALVAIVRCGAAYAPIDPAAPAREALIGPLQSPLVIGREPGMLDPSAGFAPGEAPKPEVGPDSPAYVMYTSGSTGTPKGVVVPHRAVVRLVVGADYARFGPEQRWGALSAVAFDASTLEVWGALLHGGCCVVQTIETPTLEQLADYFTNARVGSTWLTASLFNALVDEHPRSMAGMDQLLTGGERESVPHIRAFKRHCPGVTLIHGYGPTENPTFSLCHTITEDDAQQERIPIGKPIHGSTMRIVEPGAGVDAPHVPVNEGELWVGGQGLALGYLNDHARTAEKFVADAQGERWYRTGDLVRLREDGAAVFMGRVDRQVKIRGHRVEPDGVEAQLAACAGVAQAAIAVTGDTAETRRMIAFFVPQNGAEPAIVRDQLAQRLPPTMIPERFVPIASMPMGTTGKIDRNALLARLTQEPAAPTRAMTATEARLAELFALRLGHTIGPDERFQDAGGHSLLAMRLSADVRREMGVALPAAEILRRQTIACIAALVDGLPPAPDAQPPEAPNPVGDIRRRASLEHARDPTGLAMLVHQAWHLTPAIPIEQLREAWIALLERHDALRTSVRFADAGPQLVEHDPRTSPVFHAEHNRPIAPEGGDPVVRAAAVRTIGPDDPPARLHAWTMEDGSQLLLMVIHHASIDEWSLDLIADEFDALLLGEPLPEAVPHAAFVNAEHAMMDTDLAVRLAERIAGGDHGTGDPPPAGPQHGIAAHLFDAALSSDALLARATNLGVGPTALAAAAFSLALQEQFGPPGRWFLTPFARRGSDLLQRVVGCCLDMRVLEASGDTIEEVAQHLHEDMLQTQQDRTLPLEQVVSTIRTLSPTRAADATRFGLTYRHINDAPRRLGGRVARPIDIEQPAARFGLCLHVEQRTTGLRLWLEASAAHFTQEDLRGIGASIVDRLLGRASATILPADHRAQPSDIQRPTTSSREHQELAQLWQDLLGSPPQAQSDFFLSGGSSLLAMRLAAAIHKRLGRRLMLNQFLRRPTFDGLTQSIRDDEEHPYAEFSHVNVPDRHAPWSIAIPGSAGRAIDYYRFWSQLGPDAHDMLAFDQATIATGEMATFEAPRFLARFAALAHAYALRHDRHGPITVMGYSLGGLVALDTAQRLAALGHRVERVILLDAYASAFLKRTPASMLAKIHARLRHPRLPKRRPKKANTAVNHDEAHAAEANRAAWRSIHKVLSRWAPPPAACPVTLVRSAPMRQHARPLRNAATNGLGRLLGPDPDIRVVDIEHLAMLTSHASVLADTLRDRLARTPPTPAPRETPPPPTPHRPRSP